MHPYTLRQEGAEKKENWKEGGGGMVCIEQYRRMDICYMVEGEPVHKTVKK